MTGDRSRVPTWTWRCCVWERYMSSPRLSSQRALDMVTEKGFSLRLTKIREIPVVVYRCYRLLYRVLYWSTVRLADSGSCTSALFLSSDSVSLPYYKLANGSIGLRYWNLVTDEGHLVPCPFLLLVFPCHIASKMKHFSQQFSIQINNLTFFLFDKIHHNFTAYY